MVKEHTCNQEGEIATLKANDSNIMTQLKEIKDGVSDIKIMMADFLKQISDVKIKNAQLEEKIKNQENSIKDQKSLTDDIYSKLWWFVAAVLVLMINAVGQLIFK